MDDSTVELLKEVLTALLAAKGGLGIVGVATLFALRLFKHFAPKVWDKLPWYAKLGLPFLCAGAGTFLIALPTGWLPALGAALAAGAGAVGLHHATKAVGKGAEPIILVPVDSLREKGLALLLDMKRPPDNILRFPTRGK
jgi:hypothetical protein